MATNPERIEADSKDPATMCAGKLPFDECETAQLLLERNKSYEMDERRSTANGNYVLFLDDPAVCKLCNFVCAISLEIIDLKPSGEARLICTPPSTTGGANL